MIMNPGRQQPAPVVTGADVAAARTAAGLSLEAFGDLVRRSGRSVWNWESKPLLPIPRANQATVRRVINRLNRETLEREIRQRDPSPITALSDAEVMAARDQFNSELDRRLQQARVRVRNLSVHSGKGNEVLNGNGM